MNRLNDAWGATGGSVAERLEALRSAMVQRPAPAFLWRVVKGFVQIAGQWPDIMDRAGSARPDTADKGKWALVDWARNAAMTAVSMDDAQLIDPSDARAWQTFREGVEVLCAVGDIEDDLRTDLLALGVAQEPAWMVEWGLLAPPGLPDLHAAGLISAAEAGVEDVIDG